ncbi:MAG: PQQ-dependent sugar dehydrogenase [Planctomycetota bacterium]
MRLKVRAIMTAGVLFGAPAGTALGQGSFTQVTTGLTKPVFVTAPAGDFARIFVVEQFSNTTGRIKIFRPATGTTSTFLALTPVSNSDEQGLLGLAFHPDFATNRKFYVNFTDAAGTTNIREYQTFAANPDLTEPATARTLLTITQPQANHNGGWIAFGPDGFLYIGMGDGGNRDDTGSGHVPTVGNAQTLTGTLLGKMLRIDVNRDDYPGDATKNYGIPSGNPFAGGGGEPEIFAYGLRNPWRNSFDRSTGELWIADVGQDVWEEVNYQPSSSVGRNYGWRCMEATHCTGLGGCTCNAPALTLPVYEYQHASGRCSISGGYVYRGCAIPSLVGKYFFADYCTGEIFTLNPANSSVTPFQSLGFGITSFGEDAYGEMWCVRSNGRLYKLTPTGTPQFLDCNANGRPDCWDIADGTASDNNDNGVPDSCDPPCPADFDGDGTSDFFDYDAFVTCFEGGVCPPGKTADFDGDGTSDFFDYDAFVVAFEAGCP